MANNSTYVNKQEIYGNLENFESEKQIGQGQFSVVFRARCTVDGTTVALKKIKIYELMDQKAREECCILNSMRWDPCRCPTNQDQTAQITEEGSISILVSAKITAPSKPPKAYSIAKKIQKCHWWYILARYVYFLPILP